MEYTSIPSAQPILEEQLSGMELQLYIGHGNQNHINKNQLQMIIEDLKNQILMQRSINEMKALNQTTIGKENLERSSALAIVPIYAIYPVAEDTKPNQDSSATHSRSSIKKEETNWKGRDNEMKQVTIYKTTIINFFMESSQNLMNLNLKVPDDSSETEISKL